MKSVICGLIVVLALSGCIAQHIVGAYGMAQMAEDLARKNQAALLGPDDARRLGVEVLLPMCVTKIADNCNAGLLYMARSGDKEAIESWSFVVSKGGDTLTAFLLRGKNQCDTYREAYLERAAGTGFVVGECAGPLYYVRDKPR